MSDRTNSKKKIRFLKSAQARMEKHFFNLVLAYPILLSLIFLIMMEGSSRGLIRRAAVAYYILSILPFFLALQYFRGIVVPKVFVFSIKEKIKNRMEFSKRDISGFIVIFDCLFALFVLYHFNILK